MRVARDSGSFRPAMAAASLLLLLPASGQAAGFYLQDQSARGTGRAYSGEAADQGPDSLWWNPASIAGINRSEIDSNATGIFVWSKATDQGSTITRFGQTFPLGGDSRSTGVVQNGFLPSAAAALRLDDQWALGLSVTSPFSFITQYPAASWARYSALTSRLETIDVQPSLAWRPTAWLGLGIGPNFEYTLAALSSALPNLSPFEADGTETVHGDGWNVGYNAGLQLHLLDDRLVFGASYRSEIRHTLSGSLDVTGLTGFLAGENIAAPAKANFTTPWAATVGVRYRVTPRLTLEAQIVETGWSVFDAVNITQPLNASTPEGYQDTTSEAVGVDYAVTRRWLMRAGVQYDPTPTQAGSRDPRVPDADRVLFGLGTSVHVTPALTVDASALYLDASPAHINRNASAYAGTPLSTPIQLLGELKASGLVVALGTRLQF